MFDSVRNNKKIVQIFLALIALPFAFFGIDSYVRNSGVGNDLANVGDTKITLQQFDQALRERQDQMRQALGESFRVDMLNTPQERMSILNSLVDQRLLMLEASRLRITTSDAALREVISRIPSLQEDGKFSMSRYEAALRNQGISQPQFEAKLRQDLTMQQLIGAVSDTAFVSTSQAEAMLRLQSEEREYGEFRIAAEQFSSKVAIDAATVQKYYEDNRTQFEVAEKLRADYLVLSLDALLAQTKASEADIKSWYDSHKDRYQQAEERRASHILILAKSDSDKGKAKTRAEELLKEVQKTPARFAELAKQHSQDPGSATKGGDLGFFGRGMMVKAFEDAVFKQKEGEVSGVVESEFGFHIIKLTGIKAGRLRPLEEVRAEIETEVKRQTASRKYAEVAESFTNTVYEQSESLQPAAEKFGLKVQSSGWLAKNPDPREMAQPGPLANEKIRTLLFSDDAVKNKRNTEAVEVSPNTLVSARVVEFVPASIKPFDTVKADIEKKLRAQEMAAMAKAAGDARLAELKRGEDKISWSSPKRVSRMQSQQLPLETVKALFKADAEKLPAYAGASVDGSFMLYKISKITRPEKIDAEMLKGFQSELGSIAAREDLSAYFTALRSRYKIEINKSQLESRERP